MLLKENLNRLKRFRTLKKAEKQNLCNPSEVCVIFINGKLFDNSLNELTSYIMFAILGVLGIAIEAVSLKNIIKDEK